LLQANNLETLTQILFASDITPEMNVRDFFLLSQRRKCFTKVLWMGKRFALIFNFYLKKAKKNVCLVRNNLLGYLWRL
jgi:hypothetical protein